MFEQPMRKAVAEWPLHYALWIVLALCAFVTPVAAQNRPAPPVGPPDLYFLAIGIGEYTDPRPEALPQAEFSAEVVADKLIAVGAKQGILLTSRLSEGETGHAVPRGDVYRALYDLKARIRADNPVAPRIVIYAMGHGYGDPEMNLLFLQTGESQIKREWLAQMGVTTLIQKTVWNLDLISALVSFRSHPSMQHMDGFVPSQIMPDLTDPLSGLKTAMRAAELGAEDERLRLAGAYPPEGNPPVPYILLMDNCYDSIAMDLVVDAGFVGIWVQDTVGQIVSDGLVYYAAPPGLARKPVLPPERFGTRHIGPLALRFLLAVEDIGHGASFGDLEAAMDAADVIAAHRVGSPLVADTARVTFLPEGGQIAAYERRYGTGQP